jgi:asparagine synthase (glutamine-hydrolysing)
VPPFNGSTIIVIHDPRVGQSHLWTDQFGFHPCFAYKGDSAACIFSTFSDAYLADPDVHLTDDFVTMVEFARGWRGTPPHTYFREVKCVCAATRVTISTNPETVSESIYWEPFKDGFFTSIEEATEALASAVKSSIFERTAVAERPLFFVSGGSDSRVLLFSAANPERVVGVNIFEHAGTETEVARQLCAAVGSRFVAIERDNDYYPRNIGHSVRWSGGMWSVVDAHFPGVEDRIDEYDPDLVMTGCSTDWLFKGLGAEKEHIHFLGKSLPFLRYTNKRVEGFVPSWVPPPAPAQFADEVRERMNSWFKGCANDLVTPLDRLILEDRRIRPFSYNIMVSGQSMYRIFPYDTFMADSRVADCYSRIHPDWKLNRQLWGKTAARICAGAGHIIDSNYGWRVDAGNLEKALVFGKSWVGRRFHHISGRKGAIADNKPPPAGSWPDYGWYATNSRTLQELWQSATDAERQRMEMIVGFDPWQRPLAEWRYDGGFHLFRLLTLLCHWRESGSRRERSGLPPLQCDTQDGH